MNAILREIIGHILGIAIVFIALTLMALTFAIFPYSWADFALFLISPYFTDSASKFIFSIIGSFVGFYHWYCSMVAVNGWIDSKAQ